MSVTTIRKCDCCGNRMKRKDPAAELHLPQLKEESRGESYVETGFLAMAMFGARREPRRPFHICLGCVFGIIAASSMTIRERKALLAHVTDRVPDPAMVGSEVEE